MIQRFNRTKFADFCLWGIEFMS